ncbi:MAG TPA: hypothetical protein VMW10_09190 [Alphaproteobacteria bacterium]|nr:hypothetical protein [Alphaproteobacteria bacterium]
MNMFAEVMYDQIQQNISELVERILPEVRTKMKSIRTHEWVLDTELYKQSKDGPGSMYPVHRGYNREACELLVQVINFITDIPKGRADEQNVKWTIFIINSYIPKVIKQKPQPKIIKPEKPQPKVDKFVPTEVQFVCKACNYIRDTRSDFYKGRRVCKDCYSKQVVKRRG